MNLKAPKGAGAPVQAPARNTNSNDISGSSPNIFNGHAEHMRLALVAARQIRANGYMPVPLVPGDKAIKIAGWSMLAGQGEYDQLWQGAPENANIGIYSGQNVIIMDFDAKGDAPSIEVYRWLLEHRPDVFDGAILECTPSGGVHASYRWTGNAISLPIGKGKTFARFDIDGKTCDVELLTRGSQAVCPPSRTKAGEYTYLSERTHLNTQRDDLPELPDVFKDANNSYLDAIMLANRAATSRPGSSRAMVNRPDNFTDAEIAMAVSALPEIYLKNASEGHRHFQALGLACNVAGIRGMTAGDVERIVRKFFRQCSREPNSPSEISGIVRFGITHPDGSPLIPTSMIYRRRKLDAIKAMRERRGIRSDPI